MYLSEIIFISSHDLAVAIGCSQQRAINLLEGTVLPDEVESEFIQRATGLLKYELKQLELKRMPTMGGEPKRMSQAEGIKNDSGET